MKQAGAGFAVYDMEWQVIRVKLIGHWNNMDLEDNLKVVDEYVQNGGTNLRSRLWRVINCMNAVMMGWNGSNSASAASRATLVAARQRYQGMIKTQVELGEPLSWSIEPVGVKTEDLLKIRDSLQVRWQAHPQIKHRPELFEVLELVNRELKFRGF